MGFCSLQHIQDRRSTSRGLYRPATFRLQGLVTLLTVSSLRSLAGSVSHRQRSWDSPFGASSSQKVSGRLRPEAPTYRFSHRYTLYRSTGPARRTAVPGFRPFRESLATRTCLAPRPLAAPLGLAFQGSPRRPRPGFRPTSSHALWVLALRLGVSISLRSDSSVPAASRGGR